MRGGGGLVSSSPPESTQTLKIETPKPQAPASCWGWSSRCCHQLGSRGTAFVRRVLALWVHYRYQPRPPTEPRSPKPNQTKPNRAAPAPNQTKPPQPRTEPNQTPTAPAPTQTAQPQTPPNTDSSHGRTWTGTEGPGTSCPLGGCLLRTRIKPMTAARALVLFWV